MAVYTLNPLQDSRWTGFLNSHPQSSVFHSISWLQALRKTYGYEPLVYTTAAPDQPLNDAILFCRVNSWLTGRRLVSLPFSDHCQPLLSNTEASGSIYEHLRDEAVRLKYRYLELRPVECVPEHGTEFGEAAEYCLHLLELGPDASVLFNNFHKDSTQRKIRRAEREGLIYEEGKSEELQQQFYRLLSITRRRHGVPPQPRAWYRNLAQSFDESFKIRVAYFGNRPIAAMITLCFKDSMVFKFGCSDASFHKFGGVQFLFWKSILDAKRLGLRVFDLGRSDINNQGLIVFKDRLGAHRFALIYRRYYPALGISGKIPLGGADWRLQIARRVFAHAPEICLSTVGRLLYKHVA